MMQATATASVMPASRCAANEGPSAAPGCIGVIAMAMSRAAATRHGSARTRRTGEGARMAKGSVRAKAASQSP